MTKRKKFLVVIVIAIAAFLIFSIFAHITLPRMGIVIDAQTGKPIDKAVVCYFWEIDDILGPAGGKLYETTTNEKGRYFVPPLVIWRLFPLCEIDPEILLVYKHGYAANRNGCSLYGTIVKPQTFNNIIKLDRWQEGTKTRIQQTEFMGFPYFDTHYCPVNKIGNCCKSNKCKGL
jgi:hypothetical protein